MVSSSPPAIKSNTAPAEASIGQMSNPKSPSIREKKLDSSREPQSSAMKHLPQWAPSADKKPSDEVAPATMPKVPSSPSAESNKKPSDEVAPATMPKALSFKDVRFRFPLRSRTPRPKKDVPQGFDPLAMVERRH